MTVADRAKARAEEAAGDHGAAEMRRQNGLLSARNRHLESEVVELQAAFDLISRVGSAQPRPPKWLAPRAPSRAHHGTAMLLLSDLHLDETVRPEEVDRLNAYDRQVATLRLEAWTRNVVKLARDYLHAGLTWDGAVVMLGGDTFSGSIHDELKETNADTLFGGLLYWLEQMSAATDAIADHFGKVHVVSVPGNHGRMTRKPRAKLRARDNLDWLFAQLLAKQFRGDRRVTFQADDSVDARFEVYGRGHLLTHGDTVKGGGGIGGIWPPIKRLRARLAEHANTVGKPFDTLWMGHWHQLTQTPGLIINGSLKGWDEYAKQCGFSFEVPQQAFAVATPEHGITLQAPVFCLDRTKEGW